MNALSIIKGLPANKKEMLSWVENAKQEILSGEYSLVDIEIALKVASDSFDKLRKDEEVKEAVMKQVEKLTDTVNGFKLSISGKSTYKFDHNKRWSELRDEMKTIEENMKLAEQGKTIIDESTGEVFEPAIKSYSQFIKIDYPK